MGILLAFLSSIFFISIGLYIYYFSRRKKHDVVIQMWLTIIVGMAANLTSLLINLNLGNTDWKSIQFSFLLLSAIVLYSLWKVSIEYKKRH